MKNREELSMKKIYIYAVTDMAREIIRKMCETGYSVSAVIDKEANKLKNLSIDGKEIRCITLETAIEEGAKDDVVFLTNKSFVKVAETLNNLGFKNIYRFYNLANDFDKSLYLLDESKQKFFIPDKGFPNAYPFNHYESPYPDYDYICENYDIINDPQKKNLRNQFQS